MLLSYNALLSIIIYIIKSKMNLFWQIVSYKIVLLVPLSIFYRYHRYFKYHINIINKLQYIGY